MMRCLLALAALFALFAATAAQAQVYRSQPIRMIIPSTPGGGADFIGRLVSSRLAELNGWTLLPINRPGAGTALGLAEAAKSNPAGYDLVIGQTDNVSLIPLLLKVSYDPTRDRTPVALVATTPMVLIVKKDSPYKTLADAIAAAKAAPGKIAYGTSGTGGVVHISMELLQLAAGFKMQHVPYKGSAPVVARLNADINKILQRPDVHMALLAQGLEPAPQSVADFVALVRADIAKSRHIITSAGIKVE